MAQCFVNEVNAVLREGDYACPESSLITHHTSTMRMILICNKNCNSSDATRGAARLEPTSPRIMALRKQPGRPFKRRGFLKVFTCIDDAALADFDHIKPLFRPAPFEGCLLKRLLSTPSPQGPPQGRSSRLVRRHWYTSGDQSYDVVITPNGYDVMLGRVAV